MKQTHLSGIYFLTLLVFGFSFGSKGQEGFKFRETPAATVERMMNNPYLKESDKAKGETFCWYAKPGMEQYITNYDISKNTEWLDAAIKYNDFLIGKMDVDPDGYRGWIGPADAGDLWQDAMVGDAILCEGIIEFCVLVKENKDLNKKYGPKADEYLRMIKKDFFEKYDKRGCWVEDGPYASYIGFPKYVNKNNMKVWVTGPRNTNPGISNPFNKQMDAGILAIKMWRITKDKHYWDRAEKIFFTAKSHFQYFDDHYCWNYYDPLYKGDVDVARNTTRHWVGNHEWRSGYQAGEVAMIAQAYHYGMVFDEQDIKRIINTNLKVMWNGDKVNPKYINSNGAGADGDTTGMAAFRRTFGHSNVVKNAGELWTGLLDFDQTIRDLYELRFKGDKTSNAYLRYKNTILANPPGFKRKYTKGKVTVPKVDFTECRYIYMAAVLPHIIANGEKSVIICKSRKPDTLKVDVYSKDGKQLLNLYDGKIGDGFYTTTWDGKDPSGKSKFNGDYKIRWTTGNGYREFPIVIK
jgi:hypothetical protein